MNALAYFSVALTAILAIFIVMAIVEKIWLWLLPPWSTAKNVLEEVVYQDEEKGGTK